MSEKQKVSFITGGKGQCGSYLADLLLSKGYKVICLDRRSSSPDYSNIQHLFCNPNFIIEQGDVTDFGSIARIVQQYKPDELYGLAAQSHVAASWKQPIATCQIDFMGVVNCLEALRLFSPETKFLQSSTSEVYGDVQCDIQSETTEARPRSPYGAAKHGAESLVKVYKESYGLFACYSRCFNFESHRRSKDFVTRKITDWIGYSFNRVQNMVIRENIPMTTTQEAFINGILRKEIQKLKLGNIDAKRDWNYAGDTAKAMWLMLQQESPDNYVIASGKTRSVREFLSKAFNIIGIENWEQFIEIDPELYRPAEVNLLCGDASKAHEKLNWHPSVSFEYIVEEMVKHDIKLYSQIKEL